MPTKSQVKSPVLAALLHELAKTASWACYADLGEDLKTRAARLRLPYDSAAVDAAIAHVEHVTGRSLVAVRECCRRVSGRETPHDAGRSSSIGRAEAAALYAELLERAAREKVPA